MSANVSSGAAGPSGFSFRFRLDAFAMGRESIALAILLATQIVCVAYKYSVPGGVMEIFGLLKRACVAPRFLVCLLIPWSVVATAQEPPKSAEPGAESLD